MSHSVADNIITISQLNEHKTQQDLWVAVHGQVYNLTPFAEDHPGGIDVLKDCAGTDATESFDYAGHTDDAITTMQRFLIGRLAGSEYATKTAKIAKAQSPSLNGAAAKSTASSKARGMGARAFGISPHILLALLVASFGLLVALYWNLYRNARSDRGDIASELAWGVSPAHAFGYGMIFASSMSCAGLAFLYSQFSKTLKQERDVFSYPPVIPRRVWK